MAKPRSGMPTYLANLIGSNPIAFMANRKVLSHHVVINCLEWSPSFHTSNSQPTDLRWQFSAQSYLLNPLGSLLIWTLIYERTADQKILKSPGQKKLVKSNKSISRNFFDQIPFFAISKMAKNEFLNWKKFKTAKNTISRVFLNRTFLIFLAHWYRK